MNIEDFMQARVALDVNSDDEDVALLSDVIKERYGCFDTSIGDTELYSYWKYIKSKNEWKYIFTQNSNHLNASNEDYNKCPDYAIKASDFTLLDWTVKTDDIMNLVREDEQHG